MGHISLFNVSTTMPCKALVVPTETILVNAKMNLAPRACNKNLVPNLPLIAHLAPASFFKPNWPVRQTGFINCGRQPSLTRATEVADQLISKTHTELKLSPLPRAPSPGDKGVINRLFHEDVCIYYAYIK